LVGCFSGLPSFSLIFCHPRPFPKAFFRSPGVRGQTFKRKLSQAPQHPHKTTPLPCPPCVMAHLRGPIPYVSPGSSSRDVFPLLGNIFTVLGSTPTLSHILPFTITIFDQSIFFSLKRAVPPLRWSSILIPASLSGPRQSRIFDGGGFFYPFCPIGSHEAFKSPFFLFRGGRLCFHRPTLALPTSSPFFKCLYLSTSIPCVPFFYSPPLKTPLLRGLVDRVLLFSASDLLADAMRLFSPPVPAVVRAPLLWF